MAFVHGKNTVVTLDGDDLSAYATQSDFARTAGSHNVTTYGNDSMVYSGGLLDGTATISGVYDNTAATGPRAVIEPLIGTVVAFTRQPEGAGTGKPQDSCNVLVTGYTESNPVADMVTWQVDLQVSGDVNSAAQA